MFEAKAHAERLHTQRIPPPSLAEASRPTSRHRPGHVSARRSLPFYISTPLPPLGFRRFSRSLLSFHRAPPARSHASAPACTPRTRARSQDEQGSHQEQVRAPPDER